MPRTTINIDSTVLRELRRRRERENKPLGALISELLAEKLAADENAQASDPEFKWNSQGMRSRLDLEDKEAVYAAMDRG